MLSRPHFGFPPALVSKLIEGFEDLEILLKPDPITGYALPDPSDAPFIALALHACCPIITGNVRDFPHQLGLRALTPAEWLSQHTGR